MQVPIVATFLAAVRNIALMSQDTHRMLAWLLHMRGYICNDHDALHHSMMILDNVCKERSLCLQ